ncbi:MAG: hypothetical protein JW934_09060 [Anaerolineae bacterium]|nr:hypothetical protein [Anaerolineae bacterium]
MNGSPGPRWAPKVSAAKIRQLYERDALGLIDEELIDEVAYAFYARCQSILTVTEASLGRVICPECGQIIDHHSDKEALLVCPDCAWMLSWGDYFKSYKRKQLHGGGAVDVFQAFVDDLPQARTPQQKMLLIDRIVHECHKGIIREVQTFTRPVAVNLIDGTMTQVIYLLETLAYGPGSVDGAQARRQTWRKQVLSGVQGREKYLAPKDDTDE